MSGEELNRDVNVETDSDIWALAGEIASPNFYWQGEYYSRQRYELVTLEGHKFPQLRKGVPHGVPQADTISAEEADARQRTVYGHLKRLRESALRTPREGKK